MTVEQQALTVAFAASLQEATIAAGGPPRPDDHDDPRSIVPVAQCLGAAIERGVAGGYFRPFPSPMEMATQLTNLLFLRSFTRPSEDALARYRVILTVLVGVLAPEVLVAEPELTSLQRGRSGSDRMERSTLSSMIAVARLGSADPIVADRPGMTWSSRSNG